MKVPILVLGVAALAACSSANQQIKKNNALPVPAKPVPSASTQAKNQDGAQLLSTKNASKDLFGAPEANKLLMVHFAFDSAQLSDEAQSELRTNADYLRKTPNARIVIEGHCDERGSAEYNLALGERRAIAVKKYLAWLGIDASRLQTVSYGSEQPLDPAHTEQAWAENRRAQFRDVEKK